VAGPPAWNTAGDRERRGWLTTSRSRLGGRSGFGGEQHHQFGSRPALESTLRTSALSRHGRKAGPSRAANRAIACRPLRRRRCWHRRLLALASGSQRVCRRLAPSGVSKREAMCCLAPVPAVWSTAPILLCRCLAGSLGLQAPSLFYLDINQQGDDRADDGPDPAGGLDEPAPVMEQKTA